MPAKLLDSMKRRESGCPRFVDFVVEVITVDIDDAVVMAEDDSTVRSSFDDERCDDTVDFVDVHRSLGTWRR